MRKLMLAAGVVAIAAAASASMAVGQTARLGDAARALQEADASIPGESWSKARCVAVVPKAVEGKGVISCRAGEGWSAPMFVQLSKRTGFGPAGGRTAYILLVMNEQGVQKLLQNAMTLGAETVSYSRTNGAVAPVDLAGAILRPDLEANAAVYGNRARPRTILATRAISAPTEAYAFLQALNAHGSAAAVTASAPPTRVGTSGRSATAPTTDDDLRARVIDVQQLLDRLLADTTPSPVGTAGSTAPPPAASTVTVDRARLLQMREQLDALLAAMNRR
jgi:lipid-binding SYLF domain-containing protein